MEIIELSKKYKELKTRFQQLSPRDRSVLEMRFGIRVCDTCSLEVVGKQFGVTRERIRQIEQGAIKFLFGEGDLIK